jgi:gamma-glutamyl-gamma-aminobutyrate hydrolase PuuD
VNVVTIPANTWDDGTVDLALFIGGLDVSPKLYEDTGANTQASETRDSYESKYMYNRLSTYTPKTWNM